MTHDPHTENRTPDPVKTVGPYQRIRVTIFIVCMVAILIALISTLLTG